MTIITQNNEARALRNKARLEANTQLLVALTAKLSVDIEAITAYHFRLSKPNYRKLNVYPLHWKVNMVDSNRHEKVDIEAYLTKYFN